MDALKLIANIIVLSLSLTFFGGLARITYELGMSAISLHERGMVSLGKFNRSLVGNDH